MFLKKKPIFICFTGIDGSGKTTLAKKVAESMNKNGIKCQFVYARLTPFVLLPLLLIARLLFLRGKSISRNYSDYSSTRKKAVKKHSLLFRIHQQILWFDYLLQIIFKVKLPLWLGRSTVCDRYIYDTVINDLAMDVGYSEKEVKRILKRYISAFPEPDFTFLIDIPVEVAYKRKTDIPSIDYLEERNRIYQSLQKEYNMIRLDGCKTVVELEDSVFQILNDVRKVQDV